MQFQCLPPVSQERWSLWFHVIEVLASPGWSSHVPSDQYLNHQEHFPKYTYVHTHIVERTCTLLPDIVVGSEGCLSKAIADQVGKNSEDTHREQLSSMM